jgi:hypothetical protein
MASNKADFNPEQLVSVQQFATFWNLSVVHVRRLGAEGKIPTVRQGSRVLHPLGAASRAYRELSIEPSDTKARRFERDERLASLREKKIEADLSIASARWLPRTLYHRALRRLEQRIVRALDNAVNSITILLANYSGQGPNWSQHFIEASSVVNQLRMLMQTDHRKLDAFGLQAAPFEFGLLDGADPDAEQDEDEIEAVP